MLTRRGIRGLLVAGLITSTCVLFTASTATQRGYLVSVVTDCCSNREYPFMFGTVRSDQIHERRASWDADLDDGHTRDAVIVSADGDRGQTPPRSVTRPMDDLRVAIDVGPLHGHRTGVALAVEQLLAALDTRNGVELLPYIVSFRSHPQPGEQRLPMPAAFAHRWWSRVRWPPADRWLGRPHVVHGTNYVVPPARAARVVSVYDCWFLANPELAGPAVRRAGAVLRRSVANGATVHASSHATARRVRDLLATERVDVVPLGPPPLPSGASRSVPELDGRAFVLSLGTMERRKNLPELVAAFADAAGELPDVHLVLAGGAGDDTEAVEAAAAAVPTGIGRRVVRTGPVDDEQKAWLLDHATALAYPSLDEGFGFPVLEAQRAGAPVVATRAGAIAEVAGEGAELVDVGDRDALASALVRVVSDDDRRTALIEAGTANLTRFSWTATAEAMVDLYRRAAERSR